MSRHVSTRGNQCHFECVRHAGPTDKSAPNVSRNRLSKLRRPFAACGMPYSPRILVYTSRVWTCLRKVGRMPASGSRGMYVHARPTDEATRQQNLRYQSNPRRPGEEGNQREAAAAEAGSPDIWPDSEAFRGEISESRISNTDPG